MSQKDLQEDLNRAVESAYLRDVDLEDIKAELDEAEQRVEAIAGLRGDA